MFPPSALSCWRKCCCAPHPHVPALHRKTKMQNTPIVAFDQVNKSFGNFVAVENVSFEIGRGEFLAIMGSSGCGKTTTLRMLAGLEAPSQGRILLDGEEVGDKPTWSRDTPMVWQSLALFPFLTVQENVEFGLKMRKVPRKERIERARKWLDRLGILEFADRNIAQLSGGQRQRVALARSLVTEPKILLLDEPLSALDAHLKVRMQSVLSNLQKDLGITFVYVTHSMSEAFSMADRVIIMSRGKVEQIGTPEEIFHHPTNRFVAEFLGSSNIFTGVISSVNGDTLSVRTKEGVFEIRNQKKLEKQAGDSISFTVRSEQLKLDLEDSKPLLNSIVATVVGEEFSGAMANIFLETADGLELQVQKPHEEIRKLGVRHNRNVVAYFDPDQCHILSEG
ncbi:ABC transporter ATP-binding protein [Hoeflea sp. YIM 152468]|uniref:ABC transporter ATP-binding protein n=1 Tax=Hoeflea sp. YIM 152468 TaxID=3031759 RepID=UPI0023DC1A6A|nr:ABC transporter ATP-binding protein [Hoeflea sp. YIM 152468]MDF1610167.1 ABC transporter ATP-binding protein [Hoeflea sp. YIM 152468]